MADLIAVYGTLRYGASANGLLRGCHRLGEDKIKGTLHNLGSFPGIKLGGDDEVIVDVYRLPLIGAAEILQSTDRYEGYHPNAADQSLYRRLKIETVTNNYSVWIYEYAHPIHEDLRIPSGDWFNQ